MNKLVLASTSIYRRQLLEKLGIPFQTMKPHFDEDLAKQSCLAQKKTPLEIAEHLSIQKGQSAWQQLFQEQPILALDPNHTLIISGDQLVSFQGRILGKSGNATTAMQQLQALSGQTHELITAVTLLSQNKTWHLNHVTRLQMKKLKKSEIEHYLKKDEPYDCAGSYKIEQSGLILFEKIDCDDFSAIQGLPLIWISNQLQELNYEFFQH